MIISFQLAPLHSGAGPIGGGELAYMCFEVDCGRQWTLKAAGTVQLV